MDRIELLVLQRRHRERVDREVHYELPALRVISLVMLGVAMAGVGVVLFHVQTSRMAAMTLALGVLAGWPFFALGRRHARKR